MTKQMMGRMAAVVCGAALMVMPVLAQDVGAPPPPPQGGEHRGPGGPGGPEGRIREMVKELNLNEDQKQQAKGIFEEQRTKMEALHDNTSMSQEDRRHAMMKIHEEGMGKLRAILNEDQKKKLDEMEKRQREHMREGRREHRDGMGDNSTPPPPPPPQQ